MYRLSAPTGFLPRKLNALRSRLRVRTIQARGLLVSTGVVFALVAVAVTVFCLSVRSTYYSSMRSALSAKAETASTFFSTYISRTYA